MKKLFYLSVLILLLFTSCENKNSTYSEYNISVIKQSAEIDVINDDELLSIIENSLEDNKSVLNLKLTMNDVEKAKSSGLVITIEYEPAKKLYVAGAKQSISVNKILLLFYDKVNYIVVSSPENGSVTMNIPSNIINKIKRFTDNSK
jgi:hypothetical protein